MKLPEITRCHFPKTITTAQLFLSQHNTQKGTLNGRSDNKFWSMMSFCVLHSVDEYQNHNSFQVKMNAIQTLSVNYISKILCSYFDKKSSTNLEQKVTFRDKQNLWEVTWCHKINKVWSLIWGEKVFVFHKNECVVSNENINTSI